MSASGPLPECPPDFMVHPVERFLGRAMLMVVGPATDDRVQQANQQCLADRFVRLNDSTDFLHKRVRVLLRRFHQRFPERTELVGRVRKDSAFYYPPESQPERGRKRKYGRR